jgi:hypothetical protein
MAGTASPLDLPLHADLGVPSAACWPRLLRRSDRWPPGHRWLNAVESFFSTLTRRRLRRGVFCSIVELQTAINRYIDEHNDDPAPFLWTKTADQITAS